MANENTLPISVVIDPSKAEAQMREFTRTAESIFAASEARKVQQTSDSVHKVKQVNGEYQDWWKRSLGEQDRFEKMLRQAQIEDRKRDLMMQVSNQKSAATAMAEATREGLQFEKMLRQAHLEDIKQMQSKAASPLTSLGLRTLDEDKERLAKIRSAMDLVTKEFVSGNRSADEFVQTMRKLKGLENVQLFGDSRARGEIHRFLAKTASLTFELTGAFYGLVTAMSIVGAGAILGVKFQKDIEVAQMGMTGIITSMGLIDKAAISVADSWGIAGVYIGKVREDSIKYGVDMSKLTEVNRAVMAPLLSAGIKLPEIQKFATAGAVAVSALGLGTQQFVQEVRDLATAGITAANSTLATSLGVTNTMVKEWKKNGTFIEEMLKRLDGFNKTSEEMLRKTLTGSWDILKAKLGAVLQDPEAFKGIIRSINSLSDAISSPAFKTGVEFYWGALKGMARTMMDFIGIVKMLTPVLIVFAGIWATLRVIEVAKNAMLAATFVYGRAAAVVTSLTGSTIALAEAEMVQAAAARTSAAAVTGAATAAITASTAMTRAAAVGALARGLGWFGLMLWGVYEIADHFGIIDKYFTSIEERAKKTREAIKTMGDEDLKEKLANAARVVTKAESARSAEIALAKADKTSVAKANKALADAKEIYSILWDEWNKRATDEQKFKDLMPKVEGKLGLGDTGEDKKPKGHQARMEILQKEFQAQLDSDNKTLSNAERVAVEYAKLDWEHFTRKEKLAEQTKFHGALEAAKLLDIKDAHEKIISTLQKETEHYAKLGKKEPTQIETIQADIKVREARLKTLQDEIDLRKKLEKAPTEAEKSQVLGRMELFAEAQKGKFTVPAAPRGRSLDMFAATGGSDITEATQTYEDLRMKSEKKINFFTTAQLEEQTAKLREADEKAKLATVNLIGNETQKIEEETIKVGLSKKLQVLADIDKVQKLMDKSSAENKIEYQKQIDALQKKYFKEEVAAFSANFQNVFSDALQPGVNFMQKLGESFAAAMRQSITKLASEKLFENILKPATDAFANTMGSILGEKGTGPGLGSLFAPKAGAGAGAGAEAGMGLGGGALLPQLGLAMGAASLLKSAFGHGPTQYEDSRLVGTVGGTGFQGRREQTWTEKGGFLTSDNRGTIISAVLMPEIRKLNDTISNLKVTFGNFGSAVGIWGLGIKDFEFAINAAGDATNTLADGIGNVLAPALKMFQNAGETLADTAKRLTNIFSVTTDFIASLGIKTIDAFDSVGLASTKARKALTDAAGGADVFASLYSAFSSSILTDADRLKVALGKVGNTFAELGVAGVDTKEKFAALVKAETDAGHWDIVTKLLSVSDAFGQVVDSADKARKASEDLAKTQYKSALDAVDVLRKFAADTRDFMKSLWGGAQAPSQLSSGARRAEFLTTAQLAGVGDVKAQGQLQSSATGLLDFAKTQARTSLDYARSFAFVQTALDTTASTIETTVSAYDALLVEVAKANPYLADIAANTAGTKNNIVDLADITATLLKETMAGKPISESMLDAIKGVQDVNNKTLDTITGVVSGLTNLGQILQGLTTGGAAGGVVGGITAGPTTQEQIDAATAAAAAEAAANNTKQTAAKLEAYDKWMAAATVVDQLQSWWSALPDIIKTQNNLGKFNGQLFPAQAEAEKLKAIYDEMPPKFALGGTHMGGYRIVGENGPELEYTGPSHITSNADTRSLFNIEPMVNEIKELRAELRALGIPLVQNTRDTAKQLIRWDGEGLPETRIVTA